MKKLLLGLTVITFISLSAVGQDAQRRGVPAVVLNAFQQQFPKARQVEWEKKKDGNYEVEFDIGLISRDHQAIISPEGKVLRYEEEITSSSLPDAVKTQIKAEFAEYRIGDVKKIEVDGKITYAVELDSRYGDLKVDFDPEGKIVKERMD